MHHMRVVHTGGCCPGVGHVSGIGVGRGVSVGVVILTVVTSPNGSSSVMVDQDSFNESRVNNL